MYRHPSISEKLFNKTLKSTLKKLKREKNKNIVVAGDFNLDLLKFESDIRVSRFLNIMLENNLHPCITEPTRIINTNKPTLVDNIFVSKVLVLEPTTDVYIPFLS